jgi:Cu(I)/Ag(I) efflux system membrane fusion protein/Cu+-exporting ATPase
MALTPVKQFVCPMHADITATKKAKCSKCGMDLTEVKAKKG